MTEPLAFEFDIRPLAPQPCPGVYNCGDSLAISLKIRPTGNEPFSHKGIMVEYVTELWSAFTKPRYLTTPIQANAAEAGVIKKPFIAQLPQYTIPPSIQTYHGETFKVRHLIHVVVKKGFSSIEQDKEIEAYIITPCVTKLNPLCVRIAVAENIRIDLMIAKRKYELGDVILGAVHFLLVALKIIEFDVSLQVEEVQEVNGKPKKVKHVIATWEIADGAPVKGEIIPFRLYLAPLKITPSVVDESNGYSASHFLIFKILTSAEKYFKPIQIKLGKWDSLPFTFTDE